MLSSIIYKNYILIMLKFKVKVTWGLTFVSNVHVQRAVLVLGIKIKDFSIIVWMKAIGWNR
jgi:hypothetical protein